MSWFDLILAMAIIWQGSTVVLWVVHRHFPVTNPKGGGLPHLVKEVAILVLLIILQVIL